MCNSTEAGQKVIQQQWLSISSIGTCNLPFLIEHAT